MTPSIARKIGGRQALVAVGIGVLIAQIIVAFFLEITLEIKEGIWGFFSHELKFVVKLVFN